jgi:valyl-tRNA synthetase
VGRERPAACPDCGGADLVQDPDVLDTWFSSALWPFSTLGWPERTPELNTFYPTSVLVTGFDIIFFWVARMMMMGLRCMGEVPFRDVVIHGLVLDEAGQKQSKTRGNVVDPLDLIGRYGADALRMTLASQAAQGRDVRVSEQRVEGYRHFCNKVWNAYRFVAGHLGPGPQAGPMVEGKPVAGGPWEALPLDAMDRWILARLDAAITGVTEALEGYRFDEAARAIYDFIWHEYCDWYLEVAKVRLREGGPGEQAAVRRVLVTALEIGLRLLHPIMPFLSEEIWQRLPHEGPSLMVARWPEPLRVTPPGAFDLEVAEGLMDILGAVRTMRAEMNIASSLSLSSVYVRTQSNAHTQATDRLRPLLQRLARVEGVVAGPDLTPPPFSATHTIGHTVVYLPLTRAHLEKERDRLGKEIGKSEAALVKIERKLASDGFVAKAPPDVVAGVRAERDGGIAALSHLRERLGHIEATLAGG